jgi:hypothetical protein
MDMVRGLLMVAVGAFALFRGFVTLGRPNAWMTIVLGLVAVGLGVFRLTRKSPPRRSSPPGTDGMEPRPPSRRIR